MIALVIALLTDMALAAIPATGFAILFNTPPRILKYCALGGAIGHGLRFLLFQAGVPLEWGSLFSAATVSCLGVYLAQQLRAHPKVFSVAAMIPMVPGTPLFTAILALHEINKRGRAGFDAELWETALTSGLSAFFILCALAFGLAVPGLLFYRKRPVV